MPELTVVVPAYRERDNIPALLAALERSLEGRDWEIIIVVDDALDGTEGIVRERAQQDLWSRLGLVPQKAFLFTGTVAFIVFSILGPIMDMNPTL